MAGLKVSISDDDLSELLESELDRAAADIFANSQDIIIQKQIVDEGTLLKSGTINKFRLSREIVYTVPYADSIEFGRMPGTMPPFNPIFNWVRRKLGINDESKARNITYLIRRDIEKNGIDPRPFLQPAIDKYLTKVKR